MNKIIIAIGRQFGSGGREIGKQLAKELKINYYDKELIKLAAKESGLSEELFESADEKPVNSFLYSVATLGMPSYPSPLAFNSFITNDKLFTLQAEVVKKVAKDSCVIIGRCADEILKGEPGLVTVFIHADRTYRIRRISETYGVSEKEAAENIRKMDKSRSGYYEFFANKRWGDLNNYHLTLDSSMGTEKCVALLKEYIRIKNS